MRKDIEEEKRKYVQIVKEKNEITKEAKAINECALSFISKNTKGTEDKLIELIAKFNEKHFGDKL